MSTRKLTNSRMIPGKFITANPQVYNFRSSQNKPAVLLIEDNIDKAYSRYYQSRLFYDILGLKSDKQSFTSGRSGGIPLRVYKVGW